MKIRQTIGILGGGQLGRMTALAAANLNIRVVVFCKGENECASFVTDKTIIAPYEDLEALRTFAGMVDVITSEWENVPVRTLEFLESLGKPVFPKSSVFRIARDRLFEKQEMEAAGFKTTRYANITTHAECMDAYKLVGFPARLKSRFDGYDGKRQFRVNSVEALEAAWEKLNREPCILERELEFAVEMSVIVARGEDGVMKCFPPVRNEHEKGILRTTTFKYNWFGGQANWARLSEKPMRLAERMGVVGLLAVEMFVMHDRTVLANEMAPRPHNSGHWTIEGANVSQFSQLVRVLAGMPLLDVESRYLEVRMDNLLNDEADFDNVRAYFERGDYVHLYGKGPALNPDEPRKRGHRTRCGA